MISSPAAGPAGGPRRDPEARSSPGITRFDLVCRPYFGDAVLGLTRRWATDRALNRLAAERLANLVCAGVAHGQRFDPRGVTVVIRWEDPDRVRLDLRWLGCAKAARPSKDIDEVRETISTLDRCADEWGLGRSRLGWVHWMVFDTR